MAAVLGKCQPLSGQRALTAPTLAAVFEKCKVCS